MRREVLQGVAGRKRMARVDPAAARKKK